MAVTRRGYIFGAFLSSVLCVLLVIVAIASDSWVVSLARAQTQSQDSRVRYGLFRGELILNNLNTPSVNQLYLTCVSDKNACAATCKTTTEAREAEVRALANGYTMNLNCDSVTQISTDNPRSEPPVLKFTLYVFTTLLLFVMLACAALSAALAIVNAATNPTEPVFGLPGCLWSNVVTAFIGLVVMIMFGAYWASSGLKDHLAFSYTSVGPFNPVNPALGYSYWLIFPAIVCAILNIILIKLRAYLLEKDPPAPVIKVDNHSDGTIFLY
ncbi:hypothetical protein ACJJTC_003595 [Scirpophaga incertulas]